jgi:hypothetical protein
VGEVKQVQILAVSGQLTPMKEIAITGIILPDNAARLKQDVLATDNHVQIVMNSYKHSKM